MFPKLAKTLAERFQRLSLREQRLALAVASLLALFVCFRVLRGALGYLDQMDNTIDRLQGDIVNFSFQITRKESVEAQYERVAAQHSSAWTQAEIHDRLRQEIYRLAERQPSALDANGIPIGTGTASGKLVEIPAIGQGNLLETEGGFREYRLRFDIPDAELKDIVDFLDRLQMSPQALRIDGLDIIRDPFSSKVRTAVEIARIIASDTTEVAAKASGGHTAGEGLTPQELKPALWECEDCAAEMAGDVETGQTPALFARSTQGGGRFFMPRALPAGAVYELVIDARAQGEVWLGARAGDAKAENAGDQDLPVVGEGQASRYTVRYTVPGTAGARTQVQLPHFNLAEPGATVWIDYFAMDRIDE